MVTGGSCESNTFLLKYIEQYYLLDYSYPCSPLVFCSTIIKIRTWTKWTDVAKRSKIQHNVLVPITWCSTDVYWKRTNEFARLIFIYLFIFDVFAFHFSPARSQLIQFTLYTMCELSEKLVKSLRVFRFRFFVLVYFGSVSVFFLGDWTRVERSVLCYQSVNFSTLKDHEEISLFPCFSVLFSVSFFSYDSLLSLFMPNASSLSLRSLFIFFVFVVKYSWQAL